MKRVISVQTTVQDIWSSSYIGLLIREYLSGARMIFHNQVYSVMKLIYIDSPGKYRRKFKVVTVKSCGNGIPLSRAFRIAVFDNRGTMCIQSLYLFVSLIHQIAEHAFAFKKYIFVRDLSTYPEFDLKSFVNKGFFVQLFLSLVLK